MTYQDYILRHIQQAGRAWARIVRMIKDRQFEAAHMVLDQAYRQLIGLSPEAALERNTNDLIARLRFDETLRRGVTNALRWRPCSSIRRYRRRAGRWGDCGRGIHKALRLAARHRAARSQPAPTRLLQTVESLDAELWRTRCPYNAAGVAVLRAIRRLRQSRGFPVAMLQVRAGRLHDHRCRAGIVRTPPAAERHSADHRQSAA